MLFLRCRPWAAVLQPRTALITHVEQASRLMPGLNSPGSRDQGGLRPDLKHFGCRQEHTDLGPCTMGSPAVCASALRLCTSARLTSACSSRHFVPSKKSRLEMERSSGTRHLGCVVEDRPVLVCRRQRLWCCERGAARPPGLLREPLIGELWLRIRGRNNNADSLNGGFIQ